MMACIKAAEAAVLSVSPFVASKQAEVAGSSPAEDAAPKAKGTSDGALDLGAPPTGASRSSAGRALPSIERGIL